MSVREDLVCDNFKTVPVPHLNQQYEEINCTGYDIYGNLKIPDLCEYVFPDVFSHCSQCNMCTSIQDVQIKVRK